MHQYLYFLKKNMVIFFPYKCYIKPATIEAFLVLDELDLPPKADTKE